MELIPISCPNCGQLPNITCGGKHYFRVVCSSSFLDCPNQSVHSGSTVNEAVRSWNKHAQDLYFAKAWNLENN